MHMSTLETKKLEETLHLCMCVCYPNKKKWTNCACSRVFGRHSPRAARDADPKGRHLARQPPSLSRHAARRSYEKLVARLHVYSSAASASASSPCFDPFDLREPRDDFREPVFEVDGEALHGSLPALDEPISETKHAARVSSATDFTDFIRLKKNS